MSDNQSDQKVKIADLNERVVHEILEVISDGIWDWNANSGFVYRNTGWYEMLGYPAHAFENTVHTWEKIIHPEDFERVMYQFDAYINNQAERYQTEYRCRTHDGSYIWIEDRGKVVERNRDGSVSRMIGAHRNIHDRKHLLEKLELKNKSLEALVEERTAELREINFQLKQQLDIKKILSETDVLTSAANRYLLEKVLKHEYHRAKRFCQPLSLLSLDLDNFKSINDRYGHSTGDLALTHIVDIIRNNIREVDILGRWGGDEFMIVLPNTQLAEAKGIAEKIRKLIEMMPVEGNINVTMSLGVVELEPNEAQEQLLLRVDRMLYNSKASGKNIISG
ncbi:MULTISPECIES: sensor domain-containing diguanylate cyclase [Yersinia]|uniref:sensor domain-containing diguanylate cyclase n=1 Tax=Yersinia TaxID=629 RepID=UPI0005E777B0|nr:MULTISPECIES: sensor domain-containing diguanylate cyclase [Yersinia]OVZ98861.1 GGDEF domain-containing protein [Yersinia frederiksenii]RXA98502.1 diguanylate cyclase [Yersinia sp. 2105 StPb PI]CNH78622.1 diguanylate cyclase [Yersinia frederiksenii]CNI65257.1 diguanylate cyclase [Yersinia frederiksenii]CNJ95952.1 diguanylate cyclase [Yersinia frederiksenii]